MTLVKKAVVDDVGSVIELVLALSRWLDRDRDELMERRLSSSSKEEVMMYELKVKESNELRRLLNGLCLTVFDVNKSLFELLPDDIYSSLPSYQAKTEDDEYDTTFEVKPSIPLIEPADEDIEEDVTSIETSQQVKDELLVDVSDEDEHECSALGVHIAKAIASDYNIDDVDAKEVY